MVDLTAEAFAAATARGAARLRGPRAEAAFYDAGRGRVIVLLSTGIELGLDPARVEGLQGAATADLTEIEVDALGLGLHFPRLDADLYVPALLQGILGSKRWMAALLGASGGAARSEAKSAAARENGKRGGRPRKPVVAAEA